MGILHGDFYFLGTMSVGTVSTSTQSQLLVEGNVEIYGNQLISSGISASQVIKAEGTSGDLFVVTDNLIGSLASVNNISGLPVFEVFSDNTILFGDYTRRGYLTTFDTTINTTTPLISLSHSTYNGIFIDYAVQSATNSRAGTAWVVSDGTSSSIYDSFYSFRLPMINSAVDFDWTSQISGTDIVISGSTSATYSIRAIIKAI